MKVKLFFRTLSPKRPSLLGFRGGLRNQRPGPGSEVAKGRAQPTISLIPLIMHLPPSLAQSLHALSFPSLMGVLECHVWRYGHWGAGLGEVE